MKSKIVFFLLAAAAAVLLVACNQPGGANTASAGNNAQNGAPASGGKKRVAFVTNNTSDFWTIARKGTEKADAELPDIDVDFRMPADGTAAEQTRIVNDLVAGGISGIAISPKDPANQTQLINETAKKALVVTQDSDAPNSDRAVYIGTDNKAAGRQAGEMIKEAFPDGGKIMVFVGSLDSQNAKDRLAGIEEVLKDTQVKIVDTRTDDTDRARAKSNVSDAMVKDPDLAGLVGLWSYNGPAILNAVKEAGKVGKIKIICFDEEDETLAGIKEGAIYGTVVQQPFEFGYQAIKLMAKILDGDKSGIPAGKQIFVSTLMIKKDGVEEFTNKLNELRGRK
jgi:ribose transport system substrate-binding protein